MTKYEMKFTVDAQEEETPAGKRSIRRTANGSLNGHVAGKFWMNFGDAFSAIARENAEKWAGE